LPVSSFSEKANGRKLKYNGTLFFKKAVSIDTAFLLFDGSIVQWLIRQAASLHIRNRVIKPSNHLHFFVGIAFAVIGYFLKLQSA
jgi:hypothetical protein